MRAHFATFIKDFTTMICRCRIDAACRTLTSSFWRPAVRPPTAIRHFSASPLRSLSSQTSPHHQPIPGETLTLPSGRILGYHTSGPATGTPVIYVHGHPDSGLTITGSLETRAASSLNIRWIAPDRPGVGLSTPHDAFSVPSYPSDIRALTQHLGLDRYYILGTSGGTGFTLACAKDLPRKELQGVGICAGIGPVEAGFDSMSEINRKVLEGWRDYPDEFRAWHEEEYVTLAQRDDMTALTVKLRAEFEAGFTGDDRKAVLDEEAFNLTVKVMRQAWVQGGWAVAKGMEVHWKNWGFKMEDVDFPGVKLWYGGRDEATTPVMGRWMTERLPGARYTEFEGLSHYTIWQQGTLQTMLRDLLEK